ncbi:MAG TPA: MGMT family protein [Bacillota bacterium]
MNGGIGVQEKAAEKSFFREVWEVVARVPEGKVVSYGQIAAWLGKPRAARMVGWAMHSAPRDLRIPCHRVVSQSGRLAPGWETQRDELEAEGVAFRANGCVDMGKHAWAGRGGARRGGAGRGSAGRTRA